MAAAMATGLLWFKVPAAIKVTLKGKLQPMVSGKDVILHLIGEIGVDGALYQSLEFTGEGVASLSMDDRFTISNMAIEAGGKNGIFPVDEKTMEYISGRVNRPCEAFEADPDAVVRRKLGSITWTKAHGAQPWPCPTCPRTPRWYPRWPACPSTRWLSAPAPTAASAT